MAGEYKEALQQFRVIRQAADGAILSHNQPPPRSRTHLLLLHGSVSAVPRLHEAAL